jgi:lysophospholipase L1-like esterase
MSVCRRCVVRITTVVLLLLVAVIAGTAWLPGKGLKWVASWAASAHGPYPSGNPAAQPDQRFAFPSAEASDQTLRLIIRPNLWGRIARLRFSNAFGTKPLMLDGVYIGLQSFAGNLAAGSNQPVTFSGKGTATILPGQTMWSDAVQLRFVKDPSSPGLTGRKLAVSLHVVGTSGPITWHAKALQTSYASPANAGSLGHQESDSAFPYTMTSWLFLDRVDVQAAETTVVIAALGDSITDGTASTLNGDDRWPDVLSRRIRHAFGDRAVVVNLGIGGNRVIGPKTYTSAAPFSGGPSALDRMERDVLSVSGLATVIWMEGINDFGTGRESAESVIEGFREGVKRFHERGIRVVGATLTSSLGSSSESYATESVDARRRQLNEFIRKSGVFDAVVDFDAVTQDPSTGSLKAEMQPNSTIGGPGDLLHPNRSGYLAMGEAIDLNLLFPPQFFKR